jgi:hypothetical protein
MALFLVEHKCLLNTAQGVVMGRSRIGLLTFLILSPFAFAAKVPDIPTGSKIFLENKGTSDESQLFTELLGEKLSKDESSRNYVKPGFLVVDTKQDAEYTLRFIFVLRENQKSFLEGPQEHARVNVWLVDSKGTQVWEHNYDCVRVFREPARECYQHISDDLKAAQVTVDGKRAGSLGWNRRTVNAQSTSAAVQDLSDSRGIEPSEGQVEPRGNTADQKPPQRLPEAATSRNSSASVVPSMSDLLGITVRNGNANGVEITKLVAGGPAGSNLRVGDVIISVNGKPVRNEAELSDIITSLPPGAKVKLVYMVRGVWQAESSVVLAKR